MRGFLRFKVRRILPSPGSSDSSRDHFGTNVTIEVRSDWPITSYRLHFGTVRLRYEGDPIHQVGETEREHTSKRDTNIANHELDSPPI